MTLRYILVNERQRGNYYVQAQSVLFTFSLSHSGIQLPRLSFSQIYVMRAYRCKSCTRLLLPNDRLKHQISS